MQGVHNLLSFVEFTFHLLCMGILWDYISVVRDRITISEHTYAICSLHIAYHIIFSFSAKQCYFIVYADSMHRLLSYIHNSMKESPLDVTLDISISF